MSFKKPVYRQAKEHPVNALAAGRLKRRRNLAGLKRALLLGFRA
jgi:hypothetical protein